MISSIRFRKPIFTISFHRNKPFLAVGTSRGSVFLYFLDHDANYAKKLFKIKVYGLSVRNVAFSPSEIECIATNSGGNMSLFDLETRNFTWKTEFPDKSSRGISSVCFVDQNSIVSGSDNGLLQVFLLFIIYI
ncbi:hypothetical protein BMR1_01G00201 [Babesia microti strain RI]|uniref:Uncharacterized protein n=1 Tax=Babesia microti (strain RI) TaxID=1133968 RepID=A0A1N6LW90_BABMR|nr:hypothetical protein BMR1_01G00201 [Babesia microti strain RI]SIO73141.1 hypothetical protein BMR1_01G00201 [Babesia microti strain RI]|eukprot:XP_021337253.1 hypothetical protein BMR1_01G00201 [Babesia microti strain RI]